MEWRAKGDQGKERRAKEGRCEERSQRVVRKEVGQSIREGVEVEERGVTTGATGRTRLPVEKVGS